MRILHILDHGLPLQSGYTFRTRAILKSQMRRGWEVAAVTGPRQGNGDLEAEIVDDIHFRRTRPPRPLASPFGELSEIRSGGIRGRDGPLQASPEVGEESHPLLEFLNARG